MSSRVDMRREVAHLKDQLDRRLRFDVLVFIFGLLLGVVIHWWAASPPLNWWDMCQHMGVQG